MEFLEDIELAKYLDLEELREELDKGIEAEKANARDQNADVIEKALEKKIDYADRNWPDELIYDLDTEVSLNEKISLITIIDKINEDLKHDGN